MLTVDRDNFGDLDDLCDLDTVLFSNLHFSLAVDYIGFARGMMLNHW